MLKCEDCYLLVFKEDFFIIIFVLYESIVLLVKSLFYVCIMFQYVNLSASRCGGNDLCIQYPEYHMVHDKSGRDHTIKSYWA